MTNSIINFLSPDPWTGRRVTCDKETHTALRTWTTLHTVTPTLAEITFPSLTLMLSNASHEGQGNIHPFLQTVPSM